MARKTPEEAVPAAVLVEPVKGSRVSAVGGFITRLYSYARHDVASIWRAGWRPALGFTGVWVGLFAFYIAPSRGIEIDYPATLGFLTLVFVQALARSVEKHMANRTPAAG
jgi:hypothetical protein